MKKWINNNRVSICLSSAVTLLPMLFGILMWNRLPDMMITHWGADGVADGFSGKAGAVFLPTAILFLLHLVCLFATSFDKKNYNQNRKAMGIVFWIVPMVSLLVNGMMYATAFDKEQNSFWLMAVLFGLVFVIMGNYMPKVRQNRTLGVKISWTLRNEENWNKTHRLTGKLWVGGGLVLIATAFLNAKVMLCIMAVITLAMIVVPFLYSYSIYRKHQQQGIAYPPIENNKTEATAIKISAIVLPLLFVGIFIIMFTGEIHCNLTDSALEINATYWQDALVEFDTIDRIEYHNDFDVGSRNYGFGSARLSLGVFRNDALGSYTLYGYTGSHSALLIEDDGEFLVIKCKTDAETRSLYEALQEMCDK